MKMKLIMTFVLISLIPLASADLYEDYKEYRTYGNDNAIVEFDMFLSFDEPFSGRFHRDSFTELFTQYGSDGQVLFRHYDYPRVGGQYPHEAGWCVIHASPDSKKKSNFWQFREYIYTYQTNISEEIIPVWVSELGQGSVDMDIFNDCYETNMFSYHVQKDFQVATAQGLGNGVPIFKLNNEKIAGAKPTNTFKTKLNEIIAELNLAQKLELGDRRIIDGVRVEIIDINTQNATIKIEGESKTLNEYEKAIWTTPNKEIKMSVLKLLNEEIIYRMDVDVDEEQSPPPTSPPPIQLDERIVGSLDAPVTIIKYGDFTCSFCKRFNDETYPEIEQRYIDEGLVRFVYKDFPIVGGEKAAQASWCAHEQGKFWEYKELLFKRQNQINNANLVNWAHEIEGISHQGFRVCFNTGKYIDQVEKDRQEAIRNGAQGAPAFLVNGNLIVGAQPLEVFEEEIKKYIRKPVTENDEKDINGLPYEKDNPRDNAAKIFTLKPGERKVINNIIFELVSLTEENAKMLIRTSEETKNIIANKESDNYLNEKYVFTYNLQGDNLDHATFILKSKTTNNTDVADLEITDEPEVTNECLNGCQINGNCIPVGVRAEGKYCDITGDMKEQQQEENACENDYECTTNQCSSGACVDLSRQIEEQTGLLRRILNWLGFR